MFIYKQNVEQRVRKVFDWGHNWVTKIYLESEILKILSQMPKKEKHFGKAHAVSKNLWDWDCVDKVIQQRKRMLLPMNSLIIEKMFTAQYKNYLIKMLLVLMYSKGIPKIFYSYTDVKPNKCIEWLVTIKCYQPGGKRVG